MCIPGGVRHDSACFVWRAQLDFLTLGGASPLLSPHDITFPIMKIRLELLL